MKSLVELNEGEFGFIVDYTAIEEIESFFEMGILPGEKIVVKDNKQGSEWISIQLNRHITVSYTHLDVYKRQIQYNVKRREKMRTMELTMVNESNIKVVESFQKESKRLLSFIKQRVPTTQDAEDILQDVMYEFVNSFRIMKPVEQAASWMFRVARNRIIDFYRKKRPDLLDDYSYSSSDEDEKLTMADTLASREKNACLLYTSRCV